MLTFLRVMGARIRAFFKPADLDRDFEQELESHIDILAEENVRRGITPEEARREARVRLGGLAQLSEAHRERRGLPALDTLLQDLRYAFRTMRRDIGFTSFAVLIMGLGMGASTTIFGVVNALLLRPLPFSDPGRLVWIANTDVDHEGMSGETVPVGHFLALRDRNRSFSDIAALSPFYSAGDEKLTGDGEPHRLTAVSVSDNFFSVLGVKPALGRTFRPEDCQFRWFVPRVALLSDSLWRTRFHSDPAVVGRPIALNDSPVTVIGVMPSSFSFSAVFAPGTAIDIYLPYPLTEQASQRGNELAMIGRLKPGATFASGRAEMQVLGPQIQRMDPDRNFQVALSLLDDHVVGHLRPALFVLVCAVGVVMLIACANLANLLLARGATRQREMAIRAALGAGRVRLMRQLLTESVLLSCCGATIGLALAAVGTRALAHLDAFRIPLLESLRIDAGAVSFALLLAVATGLIFGSIPALQAPGAGGDSQDNARGSSRGRKQAWIRNTLVVSEIAFACVLLVGAGLLVHSFLRVLNVTLGFQPKMAAAMRIDPSSQYSTRAMRIGYFDEALRRVRSLGGIEAAGLSDVLPLGLNRTWNVGAKGIAYSPSYPPPPSFVRIVSDGYLKAMGISLRAGRDLTLRDTASSQPVILINETLARTLWPGQNAIGKIIVGAGWVDREVVGVVSDVRHLALEQESGCEMYIPIRQTGDYSSVDLVVRTSIPPAALAAPVRRTLRELDPTLPANEFRDLQDLVDKAVSPRRFVVTLLAGFSAFALILASLGIYGVISYSVNQRTREIGIRMALGAQAGGLRARIVGQTLGLAGVGILLGVAASWALARTMRSLLFGVTSTDPVTFLGMAAVLAAVAAMAGYLPARRASRIDPVSALRAE